MYVTRTRDTPKQPSNKQKSWKSISFAWVADIIVDTPMPRMLSRLFTVPNAISPRAATMAARFGQHARRREALGRRCMLPLPAFFILPAQRSPRIVATPHGSTHTGFLVSSRHRAQPMKIRRDAFRSPGDFSLPCSIYWPARWAQVAFSAFQFRIVAGRAPACRRRA